MLRRCIVLSFAALTSLFLVPQAGVADGTARNVHGFFAIDATGPSELQLWRFALDDTASNNGMVCDVTMAKGLTVPAPDTAPVVTGPCNFDHAVDLVGGLEPNTLYTFAARTRYADGSISQPTVRTAMTRTVGLYLADNNRNNHAWSVSVRPTNGVEMAAQTAGRLGFSYVVFAQAHPTQSSSVLFSSRGPGRSWTGPVTLGKAELGTPVFVSRTADGTLVAAWTTPYSVTNGVGVAGGPTYRVRPAGSSRWGAAHTTARGSLLESLTMDSRKHLHLLTGPSPYVTLNYQTNTTGRWTTQRLPMTTGIALPVGALAIDPVTSRLVVAYGTTVGPTSTLRVASKLPSARSFTSIYTRRMVRTAGMYVAAISITSYSGRITVGVRQAGQGSTGGLYVMSGTAPWNVGWFTRIAATTPADGKFLYGNLSPVVNAVSTTVVAIAFARTSSAWLRNDQGIFLTKRVYNTATHKWTFTSPSQRSASPYDRPFGVARDIAGHYYLGYFRSPCDLDACLGP